MDVCSWHTAAGALVQEFVDGLEEAVHALPRLRGDIDGILPMGPDIPPEEVRFVIDPQAGRLLRPQLGDQAVHDLGLLLPVEYAETIDVVAVCNPKAIGTVKPYIEGWVEPKEPFSFFSLRS